MLDIKALKSDLDLVAVLAARGVKLAKKGASLMAPCPFHADSTPSFSVNPKAQLWQCFGCGEGGDVFSFVMKQEGVPFFEAVKKLCRRDIRVQDLEDLNRAREREYEHAAVDRPTQPVLDRVIAHWQKMLAHTPKAHEYLKARGLWKPELLRALKIGYASGGLARMLPGGGKLRSQLTAMGIFNERGNEFFYRRIVIPIFSDGVLVGIYGRSLDPEHERAHLYLKGPRRGVFNPAGLAAGAGVILTESPLDALSLLTLGFTHVTTSWGAGGFTADIRAALVNANVARVWCAYDADPVGDAAADQLAHDLAAHCIEVRRVVMPPGAKDPNDFLKAGGTHDAFQKLLDAAQPMAAGTPTPAPAATAATSAADESDATPATPAPSADATTAPLELTLGDRTYRLEEPPVRSRGSLRVVIKATRDGKSCTDSVNLYLDRSRASFVGRLFTLWRNQVPRKILEEDLFAFTDDVTASLDAAPVTPATPAMTATDRAEAVALLKCADLCREIQEDLAALGVVGEDDNKLLAYLVATSRKMAKPLSLSVISRASAGKSWLLNRVADLMPPEDVLRYTRMSPRALFYDEPGRYKHRILFIEEAVGAKDADLPVRSMQSERRLANLATMTDPKTGKLKTQETIVEGPLTYLTSSVEPLDYETATRGFEVAIDESAAQTARIVDALRDEHTLDGIRSRLASDTILARHRNAQRLLEPVFVVNPFVRELRFPAHTLRLRREAGKYFWLITVVAFLHQHQRTRRPIDPANPAVGQYIEVIPQDVAIANRLMVVALTRALADLPGPAQELLVRIQQYVTERAASEGSEPCAIPFNRRDVREYVGWPDGQMRQHLETLATREYLEVAVGSMGKRYVYTLGPDHRLVVEAGLSIDERIRALGLTPVAELKDRS